MIEHLLLLAVGFKTVVGASPDAFLLADLAQAVTRSSARPVALVLGTLRLGTEKGNIRKRAVAAITTIEADNLEGLLGCMQSLLKARPPIDGFIQRFSHAESKLALFKDLLMNRPVDLVSQRCARGRGLGA